MNKTQERSARRGKIHARVRRIVVGTSARPRLAVFRSSKYIYAQLIDDGPGHTLAAASSKEEGLAGGEKTGSAGVDAAKAVGKAIAERAKAKGLTAVVFDRGGYLYHGRVKALAEAARASGLQF